MIINKGYSIEQLRTITKAASLYYQHGLKQPEIAERMDSSQAGVSRALRDAERLGIVRTTVHMPSDIYADLEIALEKRFGLKDAVVLEVAGQSDGERTASLGEGAAAYLENILPKAEGIAVGAWSPVLAATLASFASLRLAQKPKARTLVAFAGSDVAEYAEMMENFARLCGMDSFTRAREGMEGAEGSLRGVSLFLCAFGNAGVPPVPAAVPKRIGIAEGMETCPAIRAALAGGLLTTLVTDFKTASHLMS